MTPAGTDARCVPLGEVDRRGLATCLRIPPGLRRLVADQLDAHERKRLDDQALARDMGAARAALERLGTLARPVALSAEHEQARGYLRRALELLEHGRGDAALERMREAARALRPSPPASGKARAG